MGYAFPRPLLFGVDIFEKREREKEGKKDGFS